MNIARGILCLVLLSIPHRAFAHYGDQQGPKPNTDATATVLRWNEITTDAIALDAVKTINGEPTDYQQQPGPPRSARAIAIVHIAIFDAYNAIVGGYTNYTSIIPRSSKNNTSPQVAIAQAAHDTLVYLYSAQEDYFDAFLEQDIASATDCNTSCLFNSVRLGKKIAEKIIALRTNDGSQIPDPIVGVNYTVSNLPGHWRPDPISQNQTAVGAYWGQVTPFVIKSAQDYNAPVPPALASNLYTAAYNEVKSLGGDGIVTPTIRTNTQTVTGIYWAYDGAPYLGYPVVTLNQITRIIAANKNTTGIALARILGVLNVALGDAAIACWNAKYYYDYWRPITGIREADPGTGPTGAGDGNPNTHGDVNFTPLGAPASNTPGPNFTPPFPAYPSGHATFAGAAFQVLRKFYATDQIEFDFESDEYNGITRDASGYVRPVVVRHYTSLTQAEEEAGQSRIYLGVHWKFDKTAGIAQGRNVGFYDYYNVFVRTGP